ncbi:hypothetical protein PCASD_10732 [Puccinia coronata f. sp. avenae]|uniref:Uncharacterized protein n=1 Tax=Puccinia coronata f. sp. avenae TaxID=200324 RepID=A0A2N5UPZ3_9BASI|nr:hypothetical protein PCASD_10732 [Puccinia coronata f. sp. avenae]
MPVLDGVEKAMRLFPVMDTLDTDLLLVCSSSVPPNQLNPSTKSAIAHWSHCLSCVQQVTLVGPALVGQACPTSGHVGQRVQTDDLSNVSARHVGIGRTGTSDIWSARGVRLAGLTTCQTAPPNLGTIWAVQQVVEPACSMTHRAGRLNHLSDMGH